MSVKGMVVLDEKEELVGIVSMKDILRAILPFYMPMAKLAEFTWDGMMEQMTRKVADKKVREIMTRDVLTVSGTDPLMECVDLIVQHNLQRVPVLNPEGRVAGMIYLRDIYYAIVKILMEKDA